MAGAGGRIVNVAARPALEWRTGAGSIAYTASKAAVAALTAALAEEVAKDNPELAEMLKTQCEKLSLPNLKLAVIDNSDGELPID